MGFQTRGSPKLFLPASCISHPIHFKAVLKSETKQAKCKIYACFTQRATSETMRKALQVQLAAQFVWCFLNLMLSRYLLCVSSCAFCSEPLSRYLLCMSSCVSCSSCNFALFVRSRATLLCMCSRATCFTSPAVHFALRVSSCCLLCVQDCPTCCASAFAACAACYLVICSRASCSACAARYSAAREA